MGRPRCVLQHPETLQRKIEEAFSKDDGELRDAAAMTPFQWAGFLLQVDGMLRGVWLSLRRGVESVDLVTARIDTAGGRGLLEELRPPPAESAALGDAALEVLAFLLLKEGGRYRKWKRCLIRIVGRSWIASIPWAGSSRGAERERPQCGRLPGHVWRILPQGVRPSSKRRLLVNFPNDKVYALSKATDEGGSP